VIAATPVVEAQQSHRARPIPRLVELGGNQPNRIAIDAAGVARIACVRPLELGGGLLRVPRYGSLQSEPTLLYAWPQAISTDGRFLCGGHIGSVSGYFEEIWWDVESLHPNLIHPGETGVLTGIENTPQGLVIVGSHGGMAIDIRPPAAWSYLPVLAPGASSATSVSADGSVYAGESGGKAVRWVNRVPEALDAPSEITSSARGVSRNGMNFAGSGAGRPVVWLAQDGGSMRTLRDHDGELFAGESLGVHDSGLAFGTGSRDGASFGWLWHPDLGTDSVIRIEQWLARWRLGPVVVESVRDVQVSRDAYNFALQGGYTGPFTIENWYAETPRL
jgi:hypothetical protein